ncbi:MAG TPA: class I SAM-dependent methyltransferase [Alphaproteobacteria bacterium]|nr:class I SAM-dependent methyltransferase [Alphaproteobacteria bacterium]
MTPVEHRVRERINQSGPISIAEYMAIVLGDPEHGYYRTRDPLGTEGDFVTAPEISQVFGELIGLWCAATWRTMGAPDRVRLVELGPGRGTLMADAMRATKRVPEFLAAADIHLIETSPALRRRQHGVLAALHPMWHERFAEVPEGPCLVIANEFFDALPVEQFVRTPGGWRQRGIGINDAAGDLCFVLTDSGPTIPPAFQDAPFGVLCELRPDAEMLVGEIARRITRDGGAALIIDYGHAVRAPGETLQAVRRHRFDDVLAQPGLADLTAHVDFADVAEAACTAGADVHGPVAQGTFLDRLGLGVRMRLLCNSSPDRAEEIRAGCRRIRDPDQMGKLFKALAITPRGSPPLGGFEPNSARPC